MFIFVLNFMDDGAGREIVFQDCYRRQEGM
jgi:hypothetical protein